MVEGNEERRIEQPEESQPAPQPALQNVLHEVTPQTPVTSGPTDSQSQGQLSFVDLWRQNITNFFTGKPSHTEGNTGDNTSGEGGTTPGSAGNPIEGSPTKPKPKPNDASPSSGTPEVKTPGTPPKPTDKPPVVQASLDEEIHPGASPKPKPGDKPHSTQPEVGKPGNRPEDKPQIRNNPDGSTTEIRQNPDGTRTERDLRQTADGREETYRHYTAAGVQDGELTTVYGADNKPVRSSEKRFDAQGQVSGRTDTAFQRHADGSHTEVADKFDANNVRTESISTQYDSQDHIRTSTARQYNPDGSLKGVAESAYDTDAAGRITASETKRYDKEAGAPDRQYLGRTSRVFDRNEEGHIVSKTTTDYDKDNKLTHVQEVEFQTDVHGHVAGKEVTEKDAQGNIESVTRFDRSGNRLRDEKITRNENGEQVTTLQNYDSTGRVSGRAVTTAHADGSYTVTRQELGADGQPTRERTLNVGADGSVRLTEPGRDGAEPTERTFPAGTINKLARDRTVSGAIENLNGFGNGDAITGLENVQALGHNNLERGITSLNRIAERWNVGVGSVMYGISELGKNTQQGGFGDANRGVQIIQQMGSGEQNRMLNQSWTSVLTGVGRFMSDGSVTGAAGSFTSAFGDLMRAAESMQGDALRGADNILTAGDGYHRRGIRVIRDNAGDGDARRAVRRWQVDGNGDVDAGMWQTRRFSTDGTFGNAVDRIKAQSPSGSFEDGHARITALADADPVTGKKSFQGGADVCSLAGNGSCDAGACNIRDNVGNGDLLQGGDILRNILGNGSTMHGAEVLKDAGEGNALVGGRVLHDTLGNGDGRVGAEVLQGLGNGRADAGVGTMRTLGDGNSVTGAETVSRLGDGNGLAGLGTVRRLGDGDAIIGSQTVVRLGDGSAVAGAGTVSRLGDGSAVRGGETVARLGDGSAIEGSHNVVRLGDGSASKGADNITTLGDGSAVRGADSVVKLGDGSANRGTENVIKLGDGSASRGTESVVRLGDGSAVIGVESVQKLGDGSANTGVQSVVRLGDGSALRGVQSVENLGDGSAVTGVQSVQKMGDGSAVTGVQSISNMGDGSAVRGVQSVQQMGDGSAVRGVESVQRMGDGSAVTGVQSVQKMGDGSAVTGVQSIQKMGDGSAVTGVQSISNMGDGSSVRGVQSVQTMGDGSSVRGVQSIQAMGDGSAVTGVQNVQKMGDGSAIAGVTSVQRLGDGSAIAGVQSVQTLGDGSASKGVATVTSLGDGSAVRGVQTVQTLGDGSSLKGVQTVQTLGDGSAIRGAQTVNTLGDGSSVRGAQTVQTLGDGSAVRGAQTVQTLGDGSAIRGAQTVQTLGDGSAVRGAQTVQTMGDGSAVRGAQTVQTMGDGSAVRGAQTLQTIGNGSAVNGANTVRTLGDGSAVAGATAVQQLGNGSATRGAETLAHIGGGDAARGAQVLQQLGQGSAVKGAELAMAQIAAGADPTKIAANNNIALPPQTEASRREVQQATNLSRQVNADMPVSRSAVTEPVLASPSTLARDTRTTEENKGGCKPGCSCAKCAGSDQKPARPTTETPVPTPRPETTVRAQQSADSGSTPRPVSTTPATDAAAAQAARTAAAAGSDRPVTAGRDAITVNPVGRDLTSNPGVNKAAEHTALFVQPLSLAGRTGRDGITVSISSSPESRSLAQVSISRNGADRHMALPGATPVVTVARQVDGREQTAGKDGRSGSRLPGLELLQAGVNARIPGSNLTVAEALRIAGTAAAAAAGLRMSDIAPLLVPGRFLGNPNIQGIDGKTGVKTGKGFGEFTVRGAVFGGEKSELGGGKLTISQIRRLKGKKLNLTGAEIALAALIISSAVARQRDKDAETLAAQVKAGRNDLARLSSDGLTDENKDDDSVATQYANLVRPTWLVRPNEDLLKLAEHLFHERALGWLVADLNVGTIKETEINGKRVIELRVRQRIVLPVWQDIVKFHRSKKPANVDDLITIVEQTSVDAELMESTLASAMGVAKPATPAPRPVLAKQSQAPAAKGVTVTAAAAVPSARERALAMARKAANVMQAAARAMNHQDQGPSAGAAVTNEVQPRRQRDLRLQHLLQLTGHR